MYDEDHLYGVEGEIAFLKMIDHPNICKIYEYFIDHIPCIYFILEFCEGMNLSDFLNERREPFTEWQLGHIYSQIVSAVFYMHQNNIIHRDLKLENIMIQNNKEKDKLKSKLEVGPSTIIKIVDLENCSRYDKECTETDGIGTQVNLAPELCNNQAYNDKCDMWSMGCLLFNLLYKAHPFLENDDMDDNDTIRNIVKCKYVFPERPEVSDELKDMIRSMLELDSKKRISSKQLYYHPWINKFNTSSEINTKELTKDLFQLDGYSSRKILGNLLYEHYIKRMVEEDEKKFAAEVFKKLDENCTGA